MLKEKFLVLIKSSFSKDKKDELFDYIWKNYRRRISFYISNLIPSYLPQFEDLFQDIMLKIYRNLNTFHPSSSFKAWVYSIVRNHCLDFLKSHAEKFKAPLNPSEEFAGDRKSPERLVIEKDIFKKIDFVIQSLDTQDREIAYLRFYENLKYREICAILNLDMNATKARIRLIKIKLQKKLRRVL